MQSDEFLELCRLAMKGGSLEQVQSLLSAGVDINRKTWLGMTPLLIAADSGHKDLVELLITSGADIHGRYYGESTVLHYASSGGWKAIVEALVEKGANVNARDDFGRTPLLEAASNEHADIVELLVNCGADVNCFDVFFEQTVLHCASEKGWKEIAESIVEKGADVNARDVDGDTPLHLAVRFNRFDVVSVLLKARADDNCTNDNGESPFSCILYRGAMDAMELAIQMADYMDPACFGKMVKKHLFRYGILRDVELCTQLILNEFNGKHLPVLYAMSASKLPLMDRLKIRSDSWQELQVKEAVIRDIRREGYCDVLKTRPLVLSMLCVRQLNSHNRKI